jgi:dTDP-4-dehydrorhamnose 3,5-epimerase-like enzyme
VWASIDLTPKRTERGMHLDHMGLNYEYARCLRGKVRVDSTDSRCIALSYSIHYSHIAVHNLF